MYIEGAKRWAHTLLSTSLTHPWKPLRPMSVGAPWPLATLCHPPPLSALTVRKGPCRPFPQRSLPLRVAGCPTAAPYAPLKPSPPLPPFAELLVQRPPRCSDGDRPYLTAAAVAAAAAAATATAPNRMGRVEGRGGTDEGAGTRAEESERETSMERKGVEGRRGVDALEEGRWGMRERCGSSQH